MTTAPIIPLLRRPEQKGIKRASWVGGEWDLGLGPSGACRCVSILAPKVRATFRESQPIHCAERQHPYVTAQPSSQRLRLQNGHRWVDGTADRLHSKYSERFGKKGWRLLSQFQSQRPLLNSGAWPVFQQAAADSCVRRNRVSPTKSLAKERHPH